MKTKWMLGALVAAFGLSAVFGALMYWTDVRTLLRKFSSDESGVVWLDGSPKGGPLSAMVSPLHFVSLPQNLADYRDLGSENIQAISASDSLVVVATRGGGVSISVDNAASWYTATTSNGLPSNDAFAAFIDGERIYVGTENGVAWTDTMGRRWESRTAESGLGSGRLKVVSVYAREQMIFAGTAGAGLKVSRDAGKTWYSASEKGLDAGFVVSLAAIGDALFAATERGIYVSCDGGENWREKIVGGESGLGSHTVLSLAVCDSSLFAGTQQGLFKSSDLKGRSWTELSFSGWPPHSGVIAVSAKKRENSDECSVAVGLIGAGVGHSQNGGKGWAFFGSQQGLVAEDIYAIALTNEGILAGGAGTGLALANREALNWKHAGAPRIISAPPIVSIAANGSVLHLATQGGVATSIDGGGSWTTKSFGDAQNSSVMQVVVADEKVFAVATSGLCSMAGASAQWTCKNPTEFGFSLSDGRITSFAQLGDLAVVGSENGGVAVSKKGIVGPWQLKSAAEIGNLKVNRVRIVDGKIYVATDSTLAFSDDHGETWKKVTFGEARAVGIDVDEKGIVVALKNGGIALSQDGGVSWRLIKAAQGIADDSVNDVVLNKGTLFVATGKGLSASHDWGRSWYTSTTANGLGSNNVTSVALFGNRVFAGTDVGLSFVELGIK